MKVAVLYSGGKDSTFSAWYALSQGWEPTLLSIIPKNPESYMFHFPNIRLASLGAQAMELPHIQKETAGAKEKELEDLKNALSPLEIDGVVSGAMASEYQKTRIERICHELGLRSFSPLWHKDPEQFLRELVSAGYEILFSGVYAYGLSREWVGKKIDLKTVEALLALNRKYGLHISGEGGEYETLVLDAPHFSRKIRIDESRVAWQGDSGFLEISKAHLEEK